MANIIRCNMPDGVHRFKPFTVSDYRDFLLVRNDMDNYPEDEQQKLMDELLEDYFGDYPESWRPYLFIQVFTASIGKTKIPVAFECNECGASKQRLFNLALPPLKEPELETAGVKIKFKFPDKDYEDKTQMILENIKSVEDSDGEYKWEDIPEETQIQVIDAIDLESLEKLITEMKPFHIKFKYGCCTQHVAYYDKMVDIFKILLNPSEVFSFYQINHLLVKSHYTLDSIMSMLPIERNIALSLVEKDLK
ncbi:MAG: baseplate [Enterobacter phage ENC9]|nr:MAG: baseplate [Enterobacter phage ENC9]